MSNFTTLMMLIEVQGIFALIRNGFNLTAVRRHRMHTRKMGRFSPPLKKIMRN